MIRWLSNVFLKWGVKLNRFANKLDVQIDDQFARVDKEIERIKKDIKAQL